MKLNKVVAGVALAGMVLTTGACSSSDNKDASKKDKSTDTTMKMATLKTHLHYYQQLQVICL